jgi:hypothetical protein
LDLTGLANFIPVINSAGIVGLSLFFLYAFIRRLIVPGTALSEAEGRTEDMRKDRDDWKAIAMRGQDQTSQAVQMIQLFRDMQRPAS